MTRQPKSMVPKVRFKGFTDEWEQHKLEEIAEFYNGDRGPNYPKPSEIVEQGVPFINAGDLINGHIDYRNCKHITSDKFNQLNGAKLKINDIVYCLRGTIGKNGLVNSDANATIASSLVCIRPVKLRPLFLFQILNSSIEERQRKMVDEGAAQPNISATNLKKFLIPVPNDNEQEKIGEVFSKLNHLITLQQHKLDQLNTLKKGLLQKMFADKKHPKPELRFKSFHDNWINHKAGDFMIERNQKATIDDDFPLKAFIANKGVADKGERYDRSAITNDASNKMYKRTLFNDFIYSSNNLETGSIGLNKYGNASISPVYSIFYFKNKESADFFGRILVRKEFINSMIRYRQGVVYGQWRIKEKDFLNISISVPSLEEQEKIGSLLDKLDETINVNSKLLNQLKVLKKSLLQNMFI